MYVQDSYKLDVDAARRLIAQNQRATLVTNGAAGLTATYCVALLDGDEEPLTVVGHVAKADPQAKDVTARADALVIFDGPHGYVSASWYRPHITRVPSTWNYVAVHLHGVLEPLSDNLTFRLLERTVAHHEEQLPVDERWSLDGDNLDFAKRIAPGVTAFRLVAARVEAKAKLSQDMPPEVQQQVREGLRRPGPFENQQLAAWMEDIARSASAT